MSRNKVRNTLCKLKLMSIFRLDQCLAGLVQYWYLHGDRLLLRAGASSSQEGVHKVLVTTKVLKMNVSDVFIMV